MKNANESPEALRALIYCRVACSRIELDGSGLASQEHRCRQFAAMHGYEVEAVFTDEVSGVGDCMKRPGMVALLSYLDAYPSEDYVVIADGLSRFARDVEAHTKLHREIKARGARIECVNQLIAEGQCDDFIEALVANMNDFEREMNRHQVLNKMRARVEKGHWVFSPPVGYRYAWHRDHGKLLVRDGPVALIVAEALERFACGQLKSRAEVKRFLESKPAFPKGTSNGEIRWQRVERLLSHIIYAGYVEAPKWGIAPLKGHHEALISLATYEKIQERKGGKPRIPWQ